ncbi:MAG: redoxin family protein [Balneolaceae bacterium]
MRKLNILLSGTFLMVLLPVAVFAQQTLRSGSSLPMQSHKMEDTSGRSISMGEVAQQNGLLVIFSANTCPWVIRASDKYAQVSSLTRSNRIGMIALNSNEDYRERGDSMEDMIKHAQKRNFDFTYVLDENSEVANAFGAVRTPQVFLFNGNMELVYSGVISSSGGADNYLQDAINQMIKGSEVTISSTPPSGCSIKRAS